MTSTVHCRTALALARSATSPQAKWLSGRVLLVEDAIAAGDAESLRRAAHSRKSSSANVGGMALAGLFKQLEGLGKESRLDEAALPLAAARREYERVLAGIHALLLAEAA